MDGEAPRPAPERNAVLELIVVLLIAAAFVGVLLPLARDIQARQVASAAFRDVNAVREAAYSYRLGHGTWPPEIGTEEGPGVLGPFLPPGFSFRGDGYHIRWEHWALPGGLPPGGDSVSVIGISIRTPIERIPRDLARVLGGGVGRLTLGETTTFILEGL
jgi:hypothetical protein